MVELSPNSGQATYPHPETAPAGAAREMPTACIPRYEPSPQLQLVLGAQIAQNATLEEWKDRPAQVEVPRAELVAALKAEGKIRGFGFSGKTVEGGLKALEQGDCAMVTYNLNEQAEKAVIDYAATHGKGILVKKALASGHVCLEPGMDPIRASFMLLFAQTGVASAIVGTINPLHLAHNVATAAKVIRQL